jgi:putative N6-adenine-specific DNA methylase
LKIIAKTLEGLEEVLASEITSLGGTEIQILRRAVSFKGDKRLLYAANLQLRTCLRLLVFMEEFSVVDENDLYNKVKGVKWEHYLSITDTFAIDSVVQSTKFRHANYIALKSKDAIVDRFREKFGERPSVDVQDPDIRINIHVRENTITLSLDSSGSSLHMRGYRKSQVEAPMNEVLAAGLLFHSGWHGENPLIDPMCGSGTILCEAALLAGNIVPQRPDRKFGFKRWKSYDPDLFEIVCEDALREEKRENIPLITGFDKDYKAVMISRENIEAAGLEDYITVEKEDFFYLEGSNDATLMFNPPYDVRLKEKEIVSFYKHIGDKLKLSFQGCKAWILSGYSEGLKHIGLRGSRKKLVLNGQIPSVFMMFELYGGSKKQKWVDKYGQSGE